MSRCLVFHGSVGLVAYYMALIGKYFTASTVVCFAGDGFAGNFGGILTVGVMVYYDQRIVDHGL